MSKTTALVPARIEAALVRATDALMAELGTEGYWTGELSSSALSTATAIVALGVVDRETHMGLIRNGERWLREHQAAPGA